MNKAAIGKTAICRYDRDEECYIVQSPLFERCMGVAESENGAWKIFEELLNDYYIAYLEGRLFSYSKPGRPAKGYVELHAQVKPAIKKGLALRAKELGISQGDMIEYLCSVEQALTQKTGASKPKTKQGHPRKSTKSAKSGVGRKLASA